MNLSRNILAARRGLASRFELPDRAVRQLSGILHKFTPSRSVQSVIPSWTVSMKSALTSLIAAPSHWHTVLAATFAVAAMAAGGPAAVAQSARDIPVLKVQPDVNGVDMAMGTFIGSSPFTLASPGASHLLSQSSFNGRRINFDLTIYISDQTFIPYGDDPSGRHITVHLGSATKFFACAGFGVCTQRGAVDGATLTRAAGEKYSFVDRDGTAISFFNASIGEAAGRCIIGEDDSTSDCNDAGFSAYAHASRIAYSTGEVLTYEPAPSAGPVNGVNHIISTITSNLGYSLTLSQPNETGFVPSAVPGVWWLSYVSGRDDDLLLRLLRGGSQVRSLRTIQTGQTSQTSGTLQQTDDLSRRYRIDFGVRVASYCGRHYDSTIPAVSAATSPGGVVTSVTHAPDLDQETRTWRVSSVTRGGVTRNYTYDTTGLRQITVSSPTGGGADVPEPQSVSCVLGERFFMRHASLIR